MLRSKFCSNEDHIKLKLKENANGFLLSIITSLFVSKFLKTNLKCIFYLLVVIHYFQSNDINIFTLDLFNHVAVL